MSRSATTPSSTPTLSVALLTYNHESFIRDALDGIVGQQADFEMEVVIGEDCSTDRTREIVREYADRHPNLIRLLDWPENIGAKQNWIRVIGSCRGEFVALLDGDDYWCKPYKLQRQVDRLRADPDLALCFHAVRRLRSDGTTDCAYPPGRRSTYTFADVARYGCTHTSSVVMRKSSFPGFPSWFDKAPCGDWPTFLLALSNGDAAYIDEVMSAYRHHPASSARGWRDNRCKPLEDAAELRLLMIPEFDKARAADLTRALYKGYYQLIHERLRAGDRKDARQLLRKCLRESGYNPRVDPLEPFRALFHVCVPRLYAGVRWLKYRLTPEGRRNSVVDKSPVRAGQPLAGSDQGQA